MSLDGVSRWRNERTSTVKEPRSAPKYPARLGITLTNDRDRRIEDISGEWHVPKTYLVRACLDLVLGSQSLERKALEMAIEQLRRDDEMHC